MSTVGDIIKVKTWSPSVPCKIPDNIISSQFATQKAFVPSYEKQKRPCIEQLLTNEYQRIWWQEKASWDRRMQSKAPSKKLLHRMIIRRKPQVAPSQPKKIRKPKKKNEEKVEKSEESKEEGKNPTQKSEESKKEGKNPTQKSKESKKEGKNPTQKSEENKEEEKNPTQKSEEKKEEEKTPTQEEKTDKTEENNIEKSSK